MSYSTIQNFKQSHICMIAQFQSSLKNLGAPLKTYVRSGNIVSVNYNLGADHPNDPFQNVLVLGCIILSSFLRLILFSCAVL